MLKKSKIITAILSIVIIVTASIVSYANSNGYSLAGGFFGTNTISYKIVENQAGAYKQKYENAINDAANMWTRNVDGFRFRKTTSSNPYVEVSVKYFGHVEWAGQAYVPGGWSGTYDFGTIEINASDLDRWSWSSVERIARVITAHEFGHLLGLNHVSNNDVLMYGAGAHLAVNNNPSLATAPSASDIRGAEEAHRRYGN